MTRFYCGKTIEPDNVIVDPEYQSKGIGEIMIDWVLEYGRKENCDVSELNAYVTNPGGQRFWMNQGFRILGFHFQKLLK
jgi:ribosomal protein S18 acetylase RimI-like enzyme